MKRRGKNSCSFDLEKWLRRTINGADGFVGYRLAMSQTILNPDGNIIGYYGEGGKVQDFFGAKIGGMESVVRFSLYPGVSMETLTHHHWKQAIITRMMLGIEAEYGNPRQLRPEKILGVAFTHDLSEILGTDVNYHIKNKNRQFKAANKRRDLALHNQVIAGLRPEWRAYFPPPPDVNDEFPETERRFWEASELIGYCLFMLEEIDLDHICDENMVNFYGDVKGYVLRLTAMEEDFESARELLFWEILPKFERLKPKVEAAEKRLAPSNG